MDLVVTNLNEKFDLILFSDNAEEWIDYIHDVHPFLRIFKQKVYSFQIGKRKNSAKAFGDILKRIEKVNSQ